jgi:hypothetical protein
LDKIYITDLNSSSAERISKSHFVDSHFHFSTHLELLHAPSKKGVATCHDVEGYGAATSLSLKIYFHETMIYCLE